MSRVLLSIRDAMTKDEWKKLAQLSGTSVAYLNQMALGFRRPSVAMAERIESAVIKVSPTLCLEKESLVFAPLRSRSREE
ncbi:transcriptional regulator [Enterobacter kobei]|nr:transcriptional regulator [Enterobacter kobei]